MKLLRIIVLIMLFASCGKKDIPPSPDIFAPGLLSSEYSFNNKILCVFSENLSGNPDSVLLETEDGRRNAGLVVIEGASMSVYTGGEAEKAILFIYGAKDESGNKKDFLKIKPKGSPVEDTMAPYVSKSGFISGRMTVVFSEPAADAEISIFPEYIKFEKKVSDTGVLIEIQDTIKEPVQLIVCNIKDAAGNLSSVCYNKTFSQNDSMYPLSLSVSGFMCGDTVFLEDSLKRKIRADFADQSGTARFVKLSPGKYGYCYRGVCSDTLLRPETASEQK